MKVCVHRKGATRAFRPGRSGLPPEYQTDRPTGLRTWFDGHGLVGIGRDGKFHAALLGFQLSRSWTNDESRQSQARNSR